MSLNVEVLRKNFDLVVERSPTLTHRFYEILFERYPASRDLFPANSRLTQEGMLTQALVAVMDHLEDAPWLQSTLHALGGRHVAYRVTDEMYGWVGASLLATLAEVSGDQWNDEVQLAWTEAYGAIAGLMQEGSRLALADAKRSAAS